MQGYQGLIKIDNAIVLGTGGANPCTRSLMESNSGYGGSYGTAIGSPHIYDFPTYDLSIQFDAGQTILSTLFNWIEYESGRISSKSIKLYPRGNEVNFTDCYWTGITLGCSASANLDVSVNALVLTPPANVDFTDNYLSNKNGIITPAEFSSIQPLNASSNTNPIPFWKTKVNGFTTTGIVSANSWELSFDQVVEKKRLCNLSSVDNPYYLGVGIVNATLNLEMAIIGTQVQGEIDIPDTIASLSITVGTHTITLHNLELQNYSESVGSENNPLSLTYNIYGTVSYV